MGMHIACFIPSLFGGGAERVALNLCDGWTKMGHQIDLVVAEATGAFIDQVPSAVELVNLNTGKIRKSIGKLAQYISLSNPDVICSHLSHANIATLRALRKSGASTKSVLVEHLTMSAYKGEKFRDKLIKPIARRLYANADAVVAVSKGAAADLESTLKWNADSVRVIYNPVVTKTLISKASVQPEHQWLNESVPVILGVGRLSPQKDFETLLSAFALAQQERDLRLVILGTGELQSKLESQVQSLKIQDKVHLAGFIENPYGWMANADLFVLSSRWEALPTVLIEALACGCNVVSTDCPTGPSEILTRSLADGLVPMASPEAMAEQMIYRLDNPLSREELSELARTRFSDEQSCSGYLALFEELLNA